MAHLASEYRSVPVFAKLSNYHEVFSLNPSWADERLVETPKVDFTFASPVEMG